MKFIKKWQKDNHEVIIRANFIKNGYSPYWKYGDVQDLVKIESDIYDIKNIDKPVSLFRHGIEVWSGKHVEVLEERRFRKDVTRPFTLHEEYEKALEDAEEYANQYIDRRVYNKKMTDGLPDSLLDLI